MCFKNRKSFSGNLLTWLYFELAEIKQRLERMANKFYVA